jgi:hypothetical protein
LTKSERIVERNEQRDLKRKMNSLRIELNVEVVKDENWLV